MHTRILLPLTTFLLLAGSIPGQAQSVGVAPAVTYLLQPERVKPDTEFELALLSYQFTCGTSYDRLEAGMAGNRIDLTFLDHAHPEVVCPMVYKPYGPSYKLKALKAGSYAVYAVRLPACVEQGCKIRPVPQFVANLVVGDGPSPGWFLKEDVVKPGAPFTMQLLNKSYGNCNTEFTHATATLSEFTPNPSIYTTFAIESHPERVCVVDLRPWGPTFQLPALKPGRYPVYVTILPPCYFTTPRCLIPIKLPEVVDTLLVSATSAVLASSLRGGGEATLRGDRLSFSLPEGTGRSWEVELFAPSGERLSRFLVEGKGASRVEKKIDGGLRQGVYLLRMHSGGGEIRTHRIPLQD